MRVRRSGFTLVELLIGMLIGMIVLSGAYRMVVVQQRGYSTTGATVQDQDVLRIALGILESEFREMAAIGGADIGNSDIIAADPGGVRVRAPRTIGFVCTVKPAGESKTVTSWTDGEFFRAGDRVLLFVDNAVDRYGDDRWDEARVDNVSNSNAACGTRIADQKLHFAAHTVNGVAPGAPIRAVEEVTYGLYELHGSWGVGRVIHTPGGDEGPQLLVGGLAPEDGLSFEYLDETGATTTDPSAVAAIRVGLRTAPSSMKQPARLTSTIYLRNN